MDIRWIAAGVATLAVAARAGAAEPRELELGAGAFFHAGGSFLKEPGDRSGGPEGTHLPYHGFAGFGPGVGLGLDLRWRGVVGLELDVIESVDRGTSRTDYGEHGEVEIDVEQPALHVPVMFKGILPAGPVRPFLLAGVEFVRPRQATISAEARGGLPWNAALATTAAPYELFLFGFGLEFALPIDGIDLRIPLSFRGAVNPGVPGSARELADFEFGEDGVPTRVKYRTEWQYHAAVTAGVFYHFL